MGRFFLVAEKSPFLFFLLFDGDFFVVGDWPSQERGDGELFMMAMEVFVVRWLWLVLLLAPLLSWAKLCPDGQFEVIKTYQNECVDSCPVGYFEDVSPNGTPRCLNACGAHHAARTMSWNPNIDGEDPKGYCYKPDNSTKPFEYGVYGCDMKLYQGVLCFASGDTCQAKFRNTGELCTVAGPYGATIEGPNPDPNPDPTPEPNPYNSQAYDNSDAMPGFTAVFDKYGCFSNSSGFVSSKCFGSLNSILLQNAGINYFNSGRLGSMNDNIKASNVQLEAIRNSIDNFDVTTDNSAVLALDNERNRLLSELLKSAANSGDSGSDVDLSTTERFLDFINNNLSDISRSARGSHHFSAQIADNVRKLEIRSRDSGSGGGGDNGGGDAPDLSDVNYNLEYMVDLTKEIQRSTAATKSLADLQVGETVNGLASVKESIDGLFANSPDVHSPTSGIKFDGDYLYSKDALGDLNSEIEGLKLEYKEITTEFKKNFSFAANLEHGEYEERTLDLSIGGEAVHYEVSTLKHLLDYKAIIYSVVLLGFGLMALYSALRI